jgi:hypothetical protein
MRPDKTEKGGRDPPLPGAQEQELSIVKALLLDQPLL